MTDHEQFDRLLDKALSEYGKISPREGLEHRLLARLATPEPARRWNWRWAWAAVPALAVILIVIFFTAHPTPKRDATVTNPPLPANTAPVEDKSINVAPPAPEPQVALTRPRRRVHTVSTVAHKEPESPPKLATFPSPDETAQQARLLLRFVTRTPSEAIQVANEQEEFQKSVEASMNQDLEDRSER